ncbi:MAG: hypothetical protein CFE44_26785, partial [Burkholderiales bacterium PBB4]
MVASYGLQLAAVTVQSASQLAPGAHLQLDNGSQIAITAVPEPETAAMLLAGLALVHQWASRPLDQFCDQIAGLSERRFVTVPQPAIAEWVTLSKALNVMVARVRQMLEERDEAVGSLKDKLAHDELTQATSRDTFMASLKTHLRDNDGGGGVAIVRVHDLEGMNRRLGRNRTDEFLVALATILRTRLMLTGVDEGFMLAR